MQAEEQFSDALRAAVGPYSAIGSMQDNSHTWQFGSGHCIFSSIGSGFAGRSTARSRFVFCGGIDDHRETAEIKAFAEAVERYLGRELPGDTVVVAPAAELDHPHLDLASVAECSPAELAHPDCPLEPVNPHAPVTWILGEDLVRGGAAYLPRIMVTYRDHGRNPHDRFWFPISTGHAVHATREQALFGAASEVIERDMIALTWLQRLPLPRIRTASLGGDVRARIESMTEQFFDIEVYDLRNEYGVPAVYVLLAAPFDPAVRTIVSAGTGLTFDVAVTKALTEAFTCYTAAQLGTPAEDSLGFGASVCGAPANDHVFDFLRRGTVEIEAPTAPFAADAQAALRRILDTAASRGHAVYAQCRDTDWTRQLGLHAYAVVIPELMPFTPHRHAQYRRHPRLYQAPADLGHPVHPEEELNTWPQPFA